MIVPIAALPHHRAHILPVARLLGLDEEMDRTKAEPGDVAVIASYGDLTRVRRAGFRRIVLMQHGAGQSYGGDRRTAHNPCYAGGDDNHDVGLFLVPNEHAAKRWRQRYPEASVEVVGCPRLDVLPNRVSVAATVDRASPVVAVSFHWNGYKCPEWRSAFDWYKRAVIDLAREVTVIGHAHPRRKDLRAWYESHGIEYVPDFDDVLRRADIYACDNSSTLFEFASTGRPVIVLNAPWYRLEADHGLRFWSSSRVGVNVNEPADLVAAIGAAYVGDVDEVYAYRSGSAERAADVISEWAA